MRVPVSVYFGVPERILVRGSNVNHDGKLLIGLTFADIVIGWLSGSMNRVFESFAAKGMPWVAKRVFIDSFITGFEFTKMPNVWVNEADYLSVAVT
jgi:hypothetical protein